MGKILKKNPNGTNESLHVIVFTSKLLLNGLRVLENYP